MRTRKSPHQAGYSLAELLTVVAIVGILALVTVPNFMTYMQSNKMKVALRNFTSDMRTMRQMSISQGLQTRITFTPGATNTPASRAYDFWLGNSNFNSTTWTPLMKVYRDAFTRNDVYSAAATSVVIALATFVVSFGFLKLVGNRAFNQED